VKPESRFARIRADFHERVCRELLTKDAKGVVSLADTGSDPSKRISSELYRLLKADRVSKKAAGQSSGRIFEECCAEFIQAAFKCLSHMRPGEFHCEKAIGAGRRSIDSFQQYSHLRQVKELLEKESDLKVAFGSDYLIAPDVIIYREPEEDAVINAGGRLVDDRVALQTGIRKSNSPEPILHASISCKWTLRSDRAQNARSEGLNLVRNRKGRLPHIAVIIGEPTPNRISSLALGTGDIDCVYHFALHELREAIQTCGYEDSLELLDTMINGNRLRDISDLPLDLVV